jgi:hypothetical protein
VNQTDFIDRVDPRRLNQLDPETPEDSPPGTLEEVAPEDPTEDRDTPPAPTNPYVDPDMPGGVPLIPGHPDTPAPPMTEDDVPETWDEEAPADPEGSMPNDRSANPGILPKDWSPDNTEF